MQEEGTSAGLDGPPAPGMSRAARTADEAEAASKAAEDMTPVTYNYSFFHFIFALASMYLAMLMTGGARSEHTTMHTSWSSPANLTGILLLQPYCASCCKVPRLSQREQEKLLRVHCLLNAHIQGMILCHRMGNRGGGEGFDRCGLVLCVGEIYHTVGDCGDILLDACGAHSLPRQGVYVNQVQGVCRSRVVPVYGAGSKERVMYKRIVSGSLVHHVMVVLRHEQF